MTQDLTVTIRDEDPYVVLDVVGEIDISTASVLRDAMIEATDHGADKLVFDLRQVSFVDSVGLGVFVLARKKMQLRQGSVDIIASTRRVLAIFKLAGLEQAFRIRPTLEALSAEDDPAEPA
ncbi:STAS domain-containing protein [Aeromicrobium chenweiae]|uniref:Anti-sigma factor antagonist n=1 Tax=Aeromicrobium chenweiae TaxID=2079793 RepID=A0A2S0WKU1_9ACTN|nr:STAS domain-containing protein [Aeromicrobium chenweiae]AWB91894.1 anti-sigma B factor antagonist [Aeromicrobium chenweiae]TGN32742.1 anti-sigma factor antagonist [Aeromicrobium chenweiae]